MSKLKEPKFVNLFVSIIYSPGSGIKECINRLVDEYGEIDFESEELPFEGTRYYESEMGSKLKRKIIAFKKLIAREYIREAKIFAGNLEQRFRKEGKRTINIDPGYIAEEHVILATGKGFAHRPYLGAGVYAELTLIYRDNKYNTLEWTYPDYGTREMRGLFQALRAKYIIKLERN